MRTLFLLRGAPGAGKSTWIKENDLEPYTLSADNIRLMYQSPVMDINGDYIISQNNDAVIWNFLLELMEVRMQKGEFIVVDATHYKSSLLNAYKKLTSDYRYRCYVIDFTKVPLEAALERNRSRAKYKFVPETVIRKMYAVFEDDHEVSKRFNILTPDEAASMLHEELIFDYNKYREVVVFGDIHGCFEPLKAWFEQHEFCENTGYIFTGDYIDRGLQNKETLEFLMKISENKNVLFLEGNHEIWLRMYAENNGADEKLDDYEMKILSKYDKNILRRIKQNKIRSNEFLNYTMEQLAGLKNKDLRQFCRKLGQMAYFTFGNKKILVSHGGVPRIPDLFTASSQLIHGVGKYEMTFDLYEAWVKNSSDDIVQLHAHRNSNNHPAMAGERIYNLCSEVELGAALRIAVISKDADNKTTIEIHEIENPLPNQRLIQEKLIAESEALPVGTEDVPGSEILDMIENHFFW